MAFRPLGQPGEGDLFASAGFDSLASSFGSTQAVSIASPRFAGLSSEAEALSMGGSRRWRPGPGGHYCVATERMTSDTALALDNLASLQTRSSRTSDRAPQGGVAKTGDLPDG